MKTNYFRDTFVTRFVRIYPKAFINDMCLRVELYGCSDQAGLSYFIFQNGDILDSGIEQTYILYLHNVFISFNIFFQIIAQDI